MSETKARSFDDLYREAETHDDYWLAGVVQAFTEEVFRRMEEQKISRAELARRMGTSPAYVTKILRGNANFTLASMVKLARALGTELRIELESRETSARGQAERPARGGGAGALPAVPLAARPRSF